RRSAAVRSQGLRGRPGHRAMTDLGSSVTSEDVRFMARALALAERGRGLCSPNPMVGALVVSQGRVVGAGFHARAGSAHAEARAEAHRLRSENDVVIVGIGTALADDPSLNVRLDTPWPREPLRLVVDSRARLPLTARLIDAGAPGRAVVAVTDEAPADRVAR